MSKVDATISFEIELAISGEFVAGYAATGPSYSSGGDPAEPDSVEDIEISDMGIVTAATAPKRWQTKTLLDGVDTTCPNIQRLFANMLEQVRDQAEVELMGEA